MSSSGPGRPAGHSLAAHTPANWYLGFGSDTPATLPWDLAPAPVAEPEPGPPKHEQKWVPAWELEQSRERYARLNDTALKAYKALDKKVGEVEVLAKTLHLAKQMGQHDAIVARLGHLDDRLCTLAEKVADLTRAVAELQVQGRTGPAPGMPSS